MVAAYNTEVIYLSVLFAFAVIKVKLIFDHLKGTKQRDMPHTHSILSPNVETTTTNITVISQICQC